MNTDDRTLEDRSFEDDDDNGDYIDGSCPECGAGPDMQCDMDCSGGWADDGGDEDEDAFR